MNTETDISKSGEATSRNTKVLFSRVAKQRVKEFLKKNNTDRGISRVVKATSENTSFVVHD